MRIRKSENGQSQQAETSGSRPSGIVVLTKAAQSTGIMDGQMRFWNVFFAGCLLAGGVVHADVQPTAPRAAAGSAGGNGLELTNDEQEFSFKSRKFSLSIPGGTTFVLPPGLVLPPDMMIKLQAANASPPANLPVVENGTASGLSPPPPSVVQLPLGNSSPQKPKNLLSPSKETAKETLKVDPPAQPARQTQPLPVQRANYKESGLSAYQGYGSLVLGPAKKNDFKVLNDWE
ncbi:hypothetical protein RvY_17287 [Ramazzottius varieornatus]|uniref:Uncharacterized protein n=1 Tax=Ramazzottius varieornatus TaxID=947166 RepID=A0A1D1W1N1_RAMVA|nr:hypothetical protein RvY_17287 [Ramazzottius varieornatus]